MLRVGVALILTAIGLIGCTPTKGVHQVTYVAPGGGTPPPRSAVVSQRPDELLANLVDRLQQGDVRVVESEEASGIVVVEYSGDPEPYVDCGSIVTTQGGNRDVVPAATAEASFVRRTGRGGAEVVTVHRGLRLDSRMVISLQPEGGGSRVDAHAIYVLTKSLGVGSQQGDRGHRRETIAFETGEIARFPRGTVCLPTGNLERLAFDSLPTTDVVQTSVEPGPSTAVALTSLEDAPARPDATTSAPPLGDAAATTAGGAGAAGSAATTATTAPDVPIAPPSPPAPERTAPATPPAAVAAPASLAAALDQLSTELQCAAIDAEALPDRIRLIGYVSDPADFDRLQQTLSPLAEGRPIDVTEVDLTHWPFCEILEVTAPYRRSGSELVIGTVDGSSRLFRGDPLTLDVSLPPDAEYLYMGYVQSDGLVGYIATMSVREWAKVGRIRFRTGYEIDQPFGQEMIVAIVSDSPLFEDARPAFEPAEQYLSVLREALRNLEVRDPGGLIEAGQLFIVTEPGPAS